MRINATSPRSESVVDYVRKLELVAEDREETVLLAHLHDCILSGDFANYRERLIQALAAKSPRPVGIGDG